MCVPACEQSPQGVLSPSALEAKAKGSRADVTGYCSTVGFCGSQGYVFGHRLFLEVEERKGLFGNRRAVSGPGSATTVWQVAFYFLWRPDQNKVLERL